MAKKRMRFASAGIAVGCLAAACSPSTRAVRRGAPVADPRATSSPASAAQVARAAIRLTADPDGDDRVIADVHLVGSLASVRSLVFKPSHDARVDNLSARDRTGDIEVRVVAQGSAARFELGRQPTDQLDVRYRVTFGAKGDWYSPYAEPIELSFGGDDVLVLPDTEDSFAVEILLKTGGITSRGASSFALGNEQHFSAGAKELRAAYFVAEDVGSAAFHASDGDDFAAWVGFTAFDPRWVSAEVAGIRSAVDAYVGRTTSPNAPPNSFIFAARRTGTRDGAPIVVESRTRGLVLSVDRQATWSAAARILATQALVRRYVGGSLWVGDRKDEASGAFFSDGFSRAIARELLFDASWLSAVDRAAELNTLLAAVAFASDARGLVVARGALVATALDVALRKGSDGKRSLKTFVRERLTQGAKQAKDTISYADFVESARESAGDTAAREMDAGLHQGVEAKLPADLVGPCFRLVPKLLVQFELGFVTSSADVLTVESVKPGSRADAAGVRVGDVVSELHYEPGRSATPVKMIVQRQERKVPLRFMPAGLARPGRQFERIAGLADDRC